MPPKHSHTKGGRLWLVVSTTVFELRITETQTNATYFFKESREILMFYIYTFYLYDLLFYEENLQENSLLMVTANR